MCDRLHRLRRLAPGSRGRPRASWPCNRQSALGNRKSRSAFTLVEILVAVAIMVVLGAALIGLMSSGVEAWRRGEADRQVHEKLQAVRRQIADDLAAAVVDPPPVPDFHYALDTLWDLPASDDPYYIIHEGAANLRTDPADGTDARYFAPGTAEVILKIRVPFTIGAALLKARMDCFDKDALVALSVARNTTGTETPGGYAPIET
ncbi:type II secretion system protein, partial [bacterium]|nr:type II secretion system protein [bacterium]